MTDTVSFIKDYIKKQQELLESLPTDEIAELISIFKKAWEDNRQIFVCGNGGSAANASHFITDLSKGASDSLEKRFRGMSLVDNTPWLTALGNDYSFDEVFSRQLMNFANKGDLLMVMSVSGSSPNLVKAVQWGKENGLFTIALVGGAGGKLEKMADFVIRANDLHYGRVEDAHMGICHLICYSFMENKA